MINWSNKTYFKKYKITFLSFQLLFLYKVFLSGSISANWYFFWYILEKQYQSREQTNLIWIWLDSENET